MKLAFSTVIQDRPNYFVEKIWKGLTALSSHLEADYYRHLERHIARFGQAWDGDNYTEFLEPKLHTIREDRGGIWNSGTEIQMVIHKDTSEEFQFAPVLRCTHIQQFEILGKGAGQRTEIRIDGRLLTTNEQEMLAINDGFADSAALCSYFNTGFKGKLVHWTSMSY